MKRRFNITFEWWLDGYRGIKDVPTEHVEALEEFAFFRVLNELSQGFIEGELLYGIYDECTYRGYWKYKLEEVDDHG